MIRRIKLAALSALLLFGAMLLPSDADASGNWLSCELPLSAFSTGAAVTATATCATITDTRFVHIKTLMAVNTTFAGIVDAGPSVTAATISVGKSGSVAKYIAATNVFTGASTGWDNAAVGTPSYLPETGPITVIATLTTTSANTNVLTRGKVTVYYSLSATP